MKRTWNVEYAITGIAVLQVEAETEDEARDLANDQENEDFVINVEWEYDRIRSVRPLS